MQRAAGVLRARLENEVEPAGGLEPPSADNNSAALIIELRRPAIKYPSTVSPFFPFGLEHSPHQRGFEQKPQRMNSAQSSCVLTDLEGGDPGRVADRDLPQ